MAIQHEKSPNAGARDGHGQCFDEKEIQRPERDQTLESPKMDPRPLNWAHTLPNSRGLAKIRTPALKTVNLLVPNAPRVVLWHLCWTGRSNSQGKERPLTSSLNEYSSDQQSFCRVAPNDPS